MSSEMTIGVVAVIISVLGFIWKISKTSTKTTADLFKVAIDTLSPIQNSITELNVTMQGVQKELSILTSANDRSHVRIHSRIDEDEKRLDQHAIRLNRLETIHEIAGDG